MAAHASSHGQESSNTTTDTSVAAPLCVCVELVVPAATCESGEIATDVTAAMSPRVDKFFVADMLGNRVMYLPSCTGTFVAGLKQVMQ